MWTEERPVASLKILLDGSIVLRIVCATEEHLLALMRFIDGMARAENKLLQAPVTIDEDSPNSFISLLGLLTENGTPERLELTKGDRQILWSGDLEYWIECHEKCSHLKENRTGHQHLIVRTRNQDVEVSYSEWPI